MGSNNNNNDAAAQAARTNFFNNPQSVHAQIVSCNISVVLAHLRKKYLTSKISPSNEANKYIAAFKNFIQSKDWSANNVKLAKAIDYIEGVMAEPSNRQDRVTFWEKDSNSNEPKEVSLTISVRETLAVVCAALMDEDVYQYESDAEREKARTARIETLCNCLIDLSENSATHETARHKLAFCLNYKYPDIKFITLDFDFAWPHVRGAIIKKLSLESQWRDCFKNIIWPWIKEGEMPQAAWDLLNNSVPVTSATSSSASSVPFIEELRASLAEEFLSNGILVTDRTTDSKKAISKEIGKVIDACCNPNRIRDMDFPAIADPVITKLHRFMRSLGETEKKKKEIIALIRWLESSFDPNDNKHIAKLNKFFEIYEILEKITRYGFVLKINNNELLSTLKPMIDQYLESDLEMSEALRAKISAFNKVYFGFIESKKVAWIEGFFELLFKNKNVDHNDECARLFYKLCHPDYQASIKITDQEIMDVRGTQDLNGVTEIDVFFLNRCLLHALTIPVLEWSKVFYDILRLLYQFISNDFNTAEMRGIAGQLKKDAYPNALRKQIKYLLDYWELCPKKPDVRPAQVVLTPILIETGEEIFQGLCYMAMASNQNDFGWFTPAVNALKNKAKEFQIHNLVQVLRKCPDDVMRLRFLRVLIDKTSDFSSTQLIDILGVFAEDESRLQAFAILIDKLYGHKLSHVELENVLQEFQSVASEVETCLLLKKQVQVFKKLLLAKNFSPSEVGNERWKKSSNGINSVQQLCEQYTKKPSAQEFFSNTNRAYVGEVTKLGQAIEKTLTFDEAIEYLSQLLIRDKKQINFNDDLFVMLTDVKKSMQNGVAASVATSSFTVRPP